MQFHRCVPHCDEGSRNVTDLIRCRLSHLVVNRKAMIRKLIEPLKLDRYWQLSELPLTQPRGNPDENSLAPCVFLFLLWAILQSLVSLPLIALRYGMLVPSADDAEILGTIAASAAA